MPKKDFFEKKSWYIKFRERGYKITMAREAVLNVLGKTSKHLSAKDVYLMISKEYPSIGLTTVYRTLDILSSMGLISKFDFGDGHVRYELARDLIDKGHHHHLICVGCNKVIDYRDFIDDEVELIRLTEKGLSKKYNFKITNHLLQFYGVCDKCIGK